MLSFIYSSKLTLTVEIKANVSVYEIVSFIFSSKLTLKVEI